MTRPVFPASRLLLLIAVLLAALCAIQFAKLAADEAVPQGEMAVTSTTEQTSSDAGASDASRGTPAKRLVTLTRNTPASAADLAIIQAGIQQAVEKGLPATVGISIRGTFGSGVVVTEDGYVLTAGHVAAVPGRDCTVIFPDGKRVKAKTLGMNLDMDSGLVKITEEGKYPHVEMGHSADLKLGQWCVCLGHPGGMQPGRPPVVRAGRVLYTRDDAIGTDCTIVDGDSGGPLLDIAGRVIGIHSRISDDLTDNYHVPVDTYRDTWDRLAKGDSWGGPKPPGGPLLGINGTGDAKGCKVSDVFPNTPADKAGLRRDDIIVRFSGENVTSLDSLQSLIAKRKAGDEVLITILRGEEKVELKTKLGRRE